MTPDRRYTMMKAAVVAGMLGLSVLASPAAAQQKEMTVEELEAFIAKKKAALAQVVENRELTEQKAHRIQEALEQQNEQQKALEAEFEALCREQEQVKPDTFDQCMAEQNG